MAAGVEIIVYAYSYSTYEMTGLLCNVDYDNTPQAAVLVLAPHFPPETQSRQSLKT